MKKEPSIFILLLLASFASTSAVLFTPALPAISQALGLSSEQAQYAITVFVIGYAIGNLPYGPLSNRFGRKPTLLLGISIAIVGCLLIILVNFYPKFWLFLLGRFLSAIGSTVGLKISFTMIGDVYQHAKAIKKISYFMMAFAIGPGIAIAIGGFLTQHWEWVSTFYFLLAYSILILLASFFLPETCEEKDKDALNFSKMTIAYLNQLRNYKLILCSFLLGCGAAFVYLFAAEGPFIGIVTIGLTPEQYGLWNFIAPLGMISGMAFTHFFAEKKEPIAILYFGILIFLIASSIMLILFLLGIINPFSLFIPMIFLYIGESVLFSNSSGLALSHAHDKSNASATMNFINIGTSVVVLFIFNLTPTPIYLMSLIFVILSLLMLFLQKRLAVHLQNPE